MGVVFGSNEVTTGGTALRFYSSVRLEIRRTNQLKSDGEAFGNRVRVKVVKNKLAPPFGVVRFTSTSTSTMTDREATKILTLDRMVWPLLCTIGGDGYAIWYGCGSAR